MNRIRGLVAEYLSQLELDARRRAADAAPAGRVVVPCTTYCLCRRVGPIDKIVVDERAIDRARADARRLHARLRGGR